MNEINKKTLIEALSSLKEYNPPDAIWERIDLDMELSNDRLLQKDQMFDLPEYNPPSQVWENISSELNQSSKPKAKIVSIGWYKPLAIAASLAVLVVAYLAVQNLNDHSASEVSYKISYSKETVEERLFVKDWKDDEDSFEQYKVLCDAKQYVCEQPEFQLLQREFDELTEAISDLEYAMGDFGANAILVTQIKEIELERTGLFKKMMVMLI